MFTLSTGQYDSLAHTWPFLPCRHAAVEEEQVAPFREDDFDQSSEGDYPQGATRCCFLARNRNGKLKDLLAPEISSRLPWNIIHYQTSI
uniref:WGS project CBMI000000000 data, contig CS3069_c004321 n=1 Tax=Fusarium clavum TaxID=2594811 RepID=A0A090MKF3_9HYPO|nr:unnamed protein product [Fusarium clavum]